MLFTVLKFVNISSCHWDYFEVASRILMFQDRNEMLPFKCISKSRFSTTMVELKLDTSNGISCCLIGQTTDLQHST